MLPPAAATPWLELLDEPAALIARQDGRVVAVNAPFVMALGNAAGTALWQLLCTDDVPSLTAAIASDAAVELTLRFVSGGMADNAWRCHFGPPHSDQRLVRLAAIATTGGPRESRDDDREVRELRQKLAWFREAIDKVGHSVVIFDREDRLVLCNKFYRDGYRCGDRVLPPEITLEGRTYRELMELRVRYQLHKEFADEPEKFIEDRLRRFQDGADQITYLATGSVVRSQYGRLADGTRVYIGTNITELVEEEQRRLAMELAYRTKSQFLANMSHELRTPLNAIIGFSQLIRDATAGPVDARYRSYADDIHTAGQHLLYLINDILDLSKIEVGRMELRERAIDVHDLVAKCCRLLWERAREDGVVIEQDVAKDMPSLMADELRLKQVILNLLSNAIRFTPRHGSIRVTAARHIDGGLMLTVTDTGVGMTAEDIEKALIPFQQLDRSAGRGNDGTGLGLPLAKTLTELHGAAFHIDSKPGAGTTVTIAMPPERVLDEHWRKARGA